MYNNEIMHQCIRRAYLTSYLDKGGPFGAAVVRNGDILSISSNTVLCSKDPTAHAEINAIREACKLLGTHDLTGCELYATGYPCPMCMSAIIWANIKKVYVAAIPEDAEKIGFRDKFMYEFMRTGCSDINIVEVEYVENRKEVQTLYDLYHKSGKEMY